MASTCAFVDRFAEAWDFVEPLLLFLLVVLDAGGGLVRPSANLMLMIMACWRGVRCFSGTSAVYN